MEPQKCQHFLCDNSNEMNVMFHAWTFYDSKFTPDLNIQKTVGMCLFKPRNVYEVHQNEISEIDSAGIPFGRLGSRLVAIHDQKFSPLNAQLALEPGKLRSFYCFGKYEERCVLSYHIVPAHKNQSDILEKVISEANSLYEVVDGISNIDLELREEAEYLLKLLYGLLPNN